MSSAGMEISVRRFWPHLADIIPAIAAASFVAIDLEMTGIEPRRTGPRQTPRTMEELYAQAREATRTFRVLQLGITCIGWDGAQERIKLAPYNYHVSPLFSEGWGNGADTLARMVDRTLCISYSTLLFLKKNCVRLEDACIDGIPYLSRAEEAEVAPRLLAPDRPEQRQGIAMDDADAETRAFCAFVRETISTWEADPDRAKAGFCNISNPHGDRLNRFQQRLIYELLDDEFHGKYRAVVRQNDFMQILPKDDKEEEQFRTKTVKKREAALREQRGLRYLVEALVGGDFAADVAALGGSCGGAVGADTAGRLAAAELALKNRRPVLLGHNMFLDLCFLYATFFGPLPDSLEAFRDTIHGIFPRVIDTKYIVTQDEHDMMPARNLQDLFCDTDGAGLEGMPCDFRPPNPRSPSANHHAGFDSYMTAVVFLKEMWKRLRHVPDTDAAQEMLHWEGDTLQAFANKVRIGKTGILELGGHRA